MNKILPLTILGLLLTASVLANGGDQRVVDGGKYLVSLSRAPFTPRVGVKTTFLPSFFDIEKNKLVVEDLIVKVRIAKLGGPDKRTFIFDQKDIRVHGGVLENLSYVFTESGLHEIFFDFAFVSNSQKIYEAPDFLIDVQDKIINTDQIKVSMWGIMGGLIISLLTGWFLGRRARTT